MPPPAVPPPDPTHHDPGPAESLCEPCDPDDDVPVDGRRDLRAEANSPEHKRLHKPFNKYCDICVQCKTKAMKKMSGKGLTDPPVRECQAITGDHMSIKDFRMEPGLGGFVGVYTQKDLYSKFFWPSPVSSYEEDEVVHAIHFFGGEKDGKGISHRCLAYHSDNAPKLERPATIYVFLGTRRKPGCHKPTR